jgi:hypothetical protein
MKSTIEQQNLMKVEIGGEVKFGFIPQFYDDGFLFVNPNNRRKEFINFSRFPGISLAN